MGGQKCIYLNKFPTKHTFVIDVLDAEPETCWEGADQDVEVEEERHPRGRLVFWDRRYDGDVDLGIAAERRNMQDATHAVHFQMLKQTKSNYREVTLQLKKNFLL